MNRKFLGLTIAALLFSLGASASDTGSSAGRQGPNTDERGAPIGGGDGGTIPGGTCYFAYHIQKFGPAVVERGKNIRYRVVVTNIGNCDLRRIRVADFLPEKVEVVNVNPTPSATHDDTLIWNDIRIRVGHREVFSIEVKPEDCLRRVINNACAFTPWVGTRICDSSVTFVEREDNHHGGDETLLSEQLIVE